MQDINGYERFIGLLPGCYSMGVSRPETFAAGANLVLNSAEAPLTALTLYGWSKQDGTPSPDDPVPIESAGSVMTTGAQLIDTSLIPPYGEWDGEHDGVYLKDERTWFLKIPNNNSVARVWNEDFTKARTWGELMPTLSVGDTITFGQNVDLNETNNIAYNSDSGLVVRQGDSVTVTQGFLDALAQFYGVDGADTTCERVEIQINRGTTPLPWEPYTGGQPAANPYEGEIGVTVQGGNLFDETSAPTYTLNGITVEWLEDEQCFLFNGTLEQIVQEAVYFNIPAIKGNSYTGQTFYISGTVEIGQNSYAGAYFGAADELNEKNNYMFVSFDNQNNSRTSVCNYNYITSFWVYLTGNVTFNNYKVKIMLNEGSTPLPYELYKQPQTLTVSTPGGLPGIPVDSGGNYTDESGQQWICDEVDFKRGKYVKRIEKEILKSDAGWVKSSSTGTDGSSCYYVSQESSKKNKLITNFQQGGNYISQCYAGEYVPSDTALYLMSSISTLDEFKNWLNEEKVIEYYALSSPVETDLTAEEIAAYKALHTYSLTTTVSNDAGAWMKVGYYGLTTIQKLEKEALLINGGKT